MTTTVQPAQETQPDKPGKAPKATKAPKSTSALLALGGTPRADLLPPEIRAAQKGKAVVRMLVIFTVTVAVVVAGAVGYAVIRSLTSQAFLELERDRSSELLARQLDYAEARQISNQVDEAIAARLVGTAPEVDWKAYLDEIKGTLPAGVGLTKLGIAPVEITEGAEPTENPLQQDAVFAVTIEATSQSVPDVEAWFDDLAGVTGFAGIAPPSKVEGSPEGGYIVTLELLVNEDAFLARFQEEEVE